MCFDREAGSRKSIGMVRIFSGCINNVAIHNVAIQNVAGDILNFLIFILGDIMNYVVNIMISTFDIMNVHS